MKVFQDIENVPEEFRGSVVTIGNFDGVHLGHQFIARRLAREAKLMGVKSLLITFEPHPKKILHPNIRPFYLIATMEEKLKLLEGCGVDGILIISFSVGYARKTADEFVREVLGERLAVKKVIVGHDYMFGHGKEGNSDYLIACGKKIGFAVEVMDAFKVGSDIVSSTFIRNLIMRGEVKKASALLGRYYNVGGKVVSGRGRGIRLGFPTANIEPEKALLPLQGIYAGWAETNGKRYETALNIGEKPTFEDYAFTFEAHLLNFSGNLLGRRINVEFVERLRDIIKFENSEELKRQIAMDVEKTKAVLSEDFNKRQTL